MLEARADQRAEDPEQRDCSLRVAVHCNAKLGGPAASSTSPTTTSATACSSVDGVPVRADVAGGILTDDHFIELVTIGGVVAGVLDNGQFTALLTDPRGTRSPAPTAPPASPPPPASASPTSAWPRSSTTPAWAGTPISTSSAWASATTTPS